MKAGYLSIETHEDHSGLVRLTLSEHQPETAASVQHVPHIRYVARFNDGEAALMHTHEILKRRLIDPDQHLYRLPLVRAIGAVESLDLRHRRVFLDAEIADAATTEIAAYAARYRRHRRRVDTLFQTVGYLALLFLLLNLFILSAP